MSDPIRIPRDAEFTRRFVPRDADCGRWADIEPLFQALLQRPADSPEALERWLLDMGELAACLSEESSRRYIAMTCATGDAEREKRYMEIVEEIRPKSKPYWHELHKAYIANPHRKSLDEERYFVFDRAVRNEVDLYREENIPLTVEEQKLEQEFQKIAGAMTVQFRGEEKTLPQLKPFLEDNDRATRREAWEAEAARRLQDRDRLDEIYDSMIALRGRIARNAGFGDYTEFAFRSMERSAIMLS